MKILEPKNKIFVIKDIALSDLSTVTYVGHDFTGWTTMYISRKISGGKIIQWTSLKFFVEV